MMGQHPNMPMMPAFMNNRMQPPNFQHANFVAAQNQGGYNPFNPQQPGNSNTGKQNSTKVALDLSEQDVHAVNKKTAKKNGIDLQKRPSKAQKQSLKKEKQLKKDDQAPVHRDDNINSVQIDLNGEEDIGPNKRLMK